MTRIDEAFVLYKQINKQNIFILKKIRGLSQREAPFHDGTNVGPGTELEATQ